MDAQLSNCSAIELDVSASTDCHADALTMFDHESDITSPRETQFGKMLNKVSTITIVALSSYTQIERLNITISTPRYAAR